MKHKRDLGGWKGGRERSAKMRLLCSKCAMIRNIPEFLSESLSSAATNSTFTLTLYAKKNLLA